MEGALTRSSCILAPACLQVGVAGFAWPGFLAFLLSVLLEALRVVYIQLLLGRLNYNSMEVGVEGFCLPLSQCSSPILALPRSEMHW